VTLFLLRYDRRAGKLLSLGVFGQTERGEARRRRLDAELEINRTGVDHEVVLLEPASEADLRRTHGNCFYSLRELGDQLLRAVS
jgi:hypothetical protein